MTLFHQVWTNVSLRHVLLVARELQVDGLMQDLVPLLRGPCGAWEPRAEEHTRASPSHQSAEARFSGTVNRQVHSSHMYVDTLHTHVSFSMQGALAYSLPLQQSRDADGRPGCQCLGASEAG